MSLVANPAKKARPGTRSRVFSGVPSYLAANWPLVLVLGLVAASTIYTATLRTRSLTSGKAVRNFLSMIGEMLPPDPSVVPDLGKPMWETVVMSVMATVLAAACAFPLSFLAARTTTPHPLVSVFVKAVFSLFRTIPDLVLAIVFVASVGFGIVPGILAMGLHSVGSLGKLYGDAIEKADPGLLEAVASCGGSRLQVIVFGVIPQVFAHAADFTLYRWEMNFRASTVVGMVGAGGIGFELLVAMRLTKYQQAAAILLSILVVVQLVDQFGNLVRSRLVGPATD